MAELARRPINPTLVDPTVEQMLPSYMTTNANYAFPSFVRSVLVPMFPGSIITESNFKPSNRVTTVCSYANPTILRVRSDSKSEQFYELSRSQPFDRTERLLVQRAIEAFSAVRSQAGDLANLLEDFAVRTAVAKTMARFRQRQAETVAKILEAYTNWSSQTYEGEHVSVGAVVGPEPSSSAQGKLNFIELANEDFFKALSDGVDSWWHTDDGGNLDALIPHDAPDPKQDLSFGLSYFPDRYRGIARFSIGGNVGIALNRNGEILVFQGQLKFAKRRSVWLHFGNDAIVTQMSYGSGPSPVDVRRAIYESCLDASFARSGGCIGLLRKGELQQFLNAAVVESADLFSSCTSHKARLARELVGNRRFQAIPRVIRKELLALDGALILRHDGEVLAAGAIVELHGVGRSNQGGRSAAAKALSRFGLGIKVSEDGMISGYKLETGEKEPCFRVG